MNPATTARHDGRTGYYTIYTSDGETVLLTGRGDFGEFQRLCNALRKAETLAARRELDALSGGFSDWFARFRGQRGHP